MIKNIRNWVSHYFLMNVYDVFAIASAWLGAFWLRYNLGNIPANIIDYNLHMLPGIILVSFGCLYFFKVYRSMWRYSSVPDVIKILKAISLATILLLLGYFFLNRLHNVPRAVFPLFFMLSSALLTLPRVLSRWFRERHTGKGKRVLIVGAGYSAESLLRDLLRHHQSYVPVLFVDDDPKKAGREIHGVRVYQGIENISEFVKTHNIELIFIAIPSADAMQMRKIVTICEATQVPFRTLPSISHIVDGRVSVELLSEVSIEDLIGREPVKLDWEHIADSIENKTILVTGGAGSIGSELCRQIINLKPNKLVVIDKSEYGLYALKNELQEKIKTVKFIRCLCDVTDQVAIDKVFADHNIDIVFHAAAYKHVPLLETQIRTAIFNNLFGTQVIALAASKYDVKKFILISTDKAVNPTNIMGATKRAAEIFCQNFDRQSETKFITVRFGNVLGSSGSVVPLFRQQIKKGGPVTVTHKDITRYFMTIPEAAQLILQAEVIGDGGEIFVLDMGSPIKIKFLAEQMIRLSGLKPYQEIAIEYIGLRPGEKIYEELFHDKEKMQPTGHEKILQARSRERNWSELQGLCNMLEEGINSSDLVKLQQNLLQLVPEYKNNIAKIVNEPAPEVEQQNLAIV